ncbi:MAG: hypothetical protein EWM72_03134 [Nitrospira sp.]|nr:MAG: hypothetical protein EWM72_03134 [Nitrospira sp.]
MAMLSTRIVISLLRDEYDAFARLAPNDPDFPPTFDEWLRRAADELEKDVAKGYKHVQKVVIHPQEFADWCNAIGLKPCFIYLGAFGTAKAARKS